MLGRAYFEGERKGKISQLQPSPAPGKGTAPTKNKASSHSPFII